MRNNKRGKPYTFLFFNKRTKSNFCYQVEGKREDKKRMPICNVWDSSYTIRRKSADLSRCIKPTIFL